MITFQAVNFVYPSGARALDNVALSVNAGEVVAIVGENGAGKTTLVKMLNGLLRPQQGSVTVDGWDTSQYTTAQLAAKVGFLFQNPDEQLFERTALQEVAFGPRNLGFDAKRVEEVTRAALARVGLAEQIETNPYDMPPFERKMLAFAATLAMETKILVLDEPTIGQDAAGRERIGDILRELRSASRTVLLVSHDLDFCAEHASRFIVMAGGKILADGSAAEVLAQQDLLQKAAVTAPQLVRLAKALKLAATPLTVAEFAEAFVRERGAG
jgi:energy-coupling factor transport system ATP-binding protein